MKDMVLYLIVLLTIYLTEKEYRTRKLFLYPSFLLCPVFAVTAYAGVLVTNTAARNETENKKQKITKCCVLLLFILLIVLGGSRTLTEWFSSLLGNFMYPDPVFVCSMLIGMLSFGIYWAMGKKLCGKQQKSIWLFLFLILLMYIFGYQSMAPEKTIFIFDCVSVTLLIEQIFVPALLLLLLCKGTDRLLYEELTDEESKILPNQEGENVMKKLINVKTLTLAFIIYVLLSLFAIYTLNTKINNMSVYMQNMQESIDDLK